MLAANMTAICMCSFGSVPFPLIVIPSNTLTNSGPVATITDFSIPNLATFGMCSSMANPTVSTATTLAAGVLTPMPCIPAIVSPWVPGAPTLLIGSKPGVNQSDMTFCSFAGVITITYPGQTQVMV